MKNLVSCVAVAVVLCLVASAAAAAPCRPINSRLGPVTFLGPCTYDGTDYAGCYERRVYGTINGSHVEYAPDNNWVVSYQAPPYSSLAAGWAMSVFETSRGMIYAQNTWVWNLSLFPPLEGTKAIFPTVEVAVITGGTGHYEGAWGWIGFIQDDGTWRGFMRGEICTPDSD
jgi:hypothetical protein